jgi:dihydropteroate synthase
MVWTKSKQQSLWIRRMPFKPYKIMGVLNITPDSFSDGGQNFNVADAIDKARRMRDDGADIIDIGGESTRPRADIISPQEEMDRIMPVIAALSVEGIALSIDTRNAETMRAVLGYNPEMINDVSALTHDPESVHVIAASDCKICLMHMQGTPQTMQMNPHYDDVVLEVKNFLLSRIKFCEDHGIAKDRIFVDVGIGFGKTLDHNIALLKNLDQFNNIGAGQLLGTSRKSFIEKMTKPVAADKRIGGSLASILQAYQQGVRFFRVHDVLETKQALDVWRGLTEES